MVILEIGSYTYAVQSAYMKAVHQLALITVVQFATSLRR